MLELWNKPCPVQANPKYFIRSSLLVGLFVALFLFFFQPFGIGAIPAEARLLILAGYGLITTGVMLLYGLWLYLYMKQDAGREAQWTVFRQIIYVLLQICTIAAANFFYSAYINLISFSLEGFLFYMGVTFAIGFFPTVILTLYGYAHYLKKHIAVATATNQQMEQRPPVSGHTHTAYEEISLIGENKDEYLKLPLHHLLYGSAAGNYTEVYYLRDKITHKTLLRSSLSRLEEQLSTAPGISRCHR